MKKNNYLYIVIALLIFISFFYFSKKYILNKLGEEESASLSQGLTFAISGPDFNKSWTKEEVLNLKGRTTIVVERDPAYGDQRMVYQAVPLSEFFSDFKLDEMLTMSFNCLDGYSGMISLTRALNTNSNGSVAYIAVEEDNQKWPALKPNKPESAGPFYLIWKDPNKSKIMQEEWPYQLKGLSLSSLSFEKQFPKTNPLSSASKDKIQEEDLIVRGYSLFITNCFVCHAFNGEGSGKIGPDLNFPMSPSEYLNQKSFLTLVRNPQNLRKWDQSKMPGFSASTISDEDVESIWKYLKHMSRKRQLSSGDK